MADSTPSSVPSEGTTRGPRSGPTTLPLITASPCSPHRFLEPAKLINSGADLQHFRTSLAYRDLGTWLMQLNHALCPLQLPDTPAGKPQAWKLPGTGSGDESVAFPSTVRRLRAMLDRMEGFIAEAPPDAGPRRFGNVSFRRWCGLVEEQTDDLFREFLPRSVLEFPAATDTGGGSETPCDEDRENKENRENTSRKAVITAVDELRAYFIGSLGSAERLDYGTGHELSFLAFLGALWKLGAFAKQAEDEEGSTGATSLPGNTERAIVLGVFERYLQLIRRLILTYTLEPAGSHGVWGLDDHFFAPYIFGSAQLAPALADFSSPTPTEGSLPGSPDPASIVRRAVVERERGRNMYFSAIGFINDVKTGPFGEHSPLLYDISGVRKGWAKINSGMLKMYDEHVLGKFPVVQHFRFGSLFAWDRDPDARTPAAPTVHMASQPSAAATSSAPAAVASIPQVTTAMPPPPPPQAAGHVTAAPWATAARPGRPGVPPPFSARLAGAPGAPRSGVGGPPLDVAGGGDGPTTMAPWARRQQQDG